MASMLVRLGWLVVLLIASGCAARPALAETGGRVVDSVPHSPSECELKSDYEAGYDAGTSKGAKPAVPIVILLMKNDACGSDCRAEGCASNSPACWWTPPRVAHLFADASAINRVLRPAVRIVVERVFECQYRPGRFGQGPNDRYLPTPEPGTREWDQFSDRINQHFGVDGRVTLFVWLKIGPIVNPTVTYYGTSPLRQPVVPGRSLGTVWADRSCGVGEKSLPEPKCTRMLAHEIGHALGLVHVDRKATATPVRDGLPNCRDGATLDLRRIRQNLMIEGGTPDDVLLTGAQVCQMVTVASRYYR